MVSAMARRAHSDTVPFGNLRVPPEDKPDLVQQVFDGVASRYDVMNDLMSFGLHRLWKRALIDWLNPRPPMHLLDVAGGTGDIALRFLERMARGQRPDSAPAGTQATVVDANAAMVAVGADRAINRGLLSGIAWVCGDAEALPVADRSVDAVTIAFGIRNVTRVERALGEARRVLRPGGRFLCLEFGRVALAGLDRAYDAYSFTVVPALGRIVTGQREPYSYLVESIRHFPDQDTFSAMIAEAGLGQVNYRTLSGGIAMLHSAWRL